MTNTQVFLPAGTIFCMAAMAGSALAGGDPDAVVPSAQFPTIQSAVNGATDVTGDNEIRIVVEPGTYPENVRIDNRSNLVLFGSGSPLPMVVGAGFLETIEVEDSTNITIAFFRVTSEGTGDGIELTRSNSCLISNCEVFGNLDGIGIFANVGG